MPFLQHDTGEKIGNNQPKQKDEIVVTRRRQTQPDRRLEVGGWNQQLREEESSSSSPDVADTPRNMVPLTCFPPAHPDAFVSHTEMARPASLLCNNRTIAELSNNFASLALPGSSNSSILSTTRNNYEAENNASSWMFGRSNGGETVANRRASFCGLPSVRVDQTPSWEGILPQRHHDTNEEYSSKVFLGGLPWDITELALKHAFRSFHPTKVEWPASRGAVDSSVLGAHPAVEPRGYAYVTFENERKVRALLSASRMDNEDWYFQVSSRKMRKKEVQVIPWCVSYSAWVSGAGARVESRLTVFVGALHGMITAQALAQIMNNVFGGVIYAGIDSDRYKYPIGSGRVTFNNVRSYVRAVSAGYLDIITNKFTKRVQLDPYLEDSMCSICNIQQGPYFCREPTCFKYFCRFCWAYQHKANQKHRPLMKNPKTNIDMTAFDGTHNANSTKGNTNSSHRQSEEDFYSDLFGHRNPWNE